MGATQTSTPSSGDPAAVVERSVEAPSPALAPPPGNPRFPLFDGLRGLAVLGILAFHATELTGRVGFGLIGRAAEALGSVVPMLFFAISGFLLYRPYVSARANGRGAPRAARYARRRALRILPAYVTAVTVLAIYPGIIGPFSGDWWRYYGYLQLYSQRTLGDGIPVAWTLCVEVTFYIALPAWALAVRRIPLGKGLVRAELTPLAIVAAGGVAVQLAAARKLTSYVLGISIAGQCTWLCLGMALAVASVAVQMDRSSFTALRALAGHPSLCWAGSALALGGMMVLVPTDGLFGLIASVQVRQSLATSLAKLALAGVLVALLVLPASFGDERQGLPRRVLAMRPLVWLGVISYSFYLYHLTVAELIAWLHGPGAFSAAGVDLLAHVHTARTLVLYVLTLIATVLVATVSYRLVELPLLRRKETRTALYPPAR